MLALASVAVAQGDSATAQRWAEQAQRNYTAEVKVKPNDPLPRIRLAEAMLMLGQFTEALNVLKTGITQSGDRLYHEMAARVCAEWARKVVRESPGDFSTRLSLIQRGLEYAPNNEQLLVQLVALSNLSGKEAAEARSRINGLLTAGGSETAILHFFLGSDAWQRGQAEEARQHFALAFDMAPQMPYAANNAAMFMAQGDKPDLPRALGMIQSVLDKFPTNPRFRDTRGHILVKMSRWQEAVKDLEFSLPALPAKSATRKALAEAYRHLGLQDLAAEQERLAESEQSPSLTGAKAAAE
jgi:predicted Zn-dependent protease